MVSTWETRNITELLKPNGIKIGPFGSQLKKDLFIQNGNYKVYGQENVYAKDFTIGNRYMTRSHFDKLESCEILPGDFVMSTMGTIGKCAIVPSNITRGIMDSHLIRLRFDENLISPSYLLQLFSPDIQYLTNQTDKLSVGGIMDGLSVKIVSSLTVEYPQSIEEQEHIVDVLSDIDNMISSLEKLIAKKKAIKQGVMQELFTGKKRVPGFTDEWITEYLGNLCVIARGGSPRPIQDYLTTSDSGINWIKIGDVKPNTKYITSTQEKIIESGVSMSRRVYYGDFILSNSMSFGRPYILKIDGCIHDGWLAIQDYQASFDRDFLYYLLSSEYVYNQYVQMAAGSSVQNLNKDKVAKLLVKIPPIREQIAIASILSDIDNEIETLEQKFAKIRQIKQGMMQQLLTGKIRLV